MTALPDRIELRAPRLNLFLLFLVCLAFVAAGAWMLDRSESWGWLTIGFFGIGVAVFPLMIVGGAGVALDREGFTVRTAFRRTRYEWSDVSAFSTAYVQGTRLMVFDDLKRKSGWVSQVNRDLVGGNSSIPGSIIPGSLDEACTLFNAFRERAAVA